MMTYQFAIQIIFVTPIKGMCKEYITGKNIQSEKQASKKFTE
jgi:hypothetical protein